MIVITDLEINKRLCIPEDEIVLTLDNKNGQEIAIKRKFNKEVNLPYKVIFHFTLDDGTCLNQTLQGGLFDDNKLPKELQNAIMVNDLPLAQKDNFCRTFGGLTSTNYYDKIDLSKKPKLSCKVCGERIYPYLTNDSINGIHHRCKTDKFKLFKSERFKIALKHNVPYESVIKQIDHIAILLDRGYSNTCATGGYRIGFSP